MKNVRLNTKLISSLSTVLFIPTAELIVATGITNSTWYRIMQAPVCISIQQLLAVANSLHIPVRRFFSTDKVDVIGRRDDYIATVYTPCYYDEEGLQRLVNERADATWKKAAKATGMSYSRLRNSLLAVTRTPVVRFLTVCEVFGIDPFTILIDPNPEMKQRNKRDTSSKAGDLTDQVAALRKDVTELSATVEDLTKKYQALLKEHEQLARRVSVNIENIHGSYVGIAADP